MFCARIPKLDSSASCFIQSRTLGACPDYRSGEAKTRSAGRDLALFTPFGGPLACCKGRRQRGGQTPPLGQLCKCQLQKIMDGADDGPLGAPALDAAQQELTEAASLLDLPEHRLRPLVGRPIRSGGGGGPCS